MAGKKLTKAPNRKLLLSEAVEIMTRQGMSEKDMQRVGELFAKYFAS